MPAAYQFDGSHRYIANQFYPVQHLFVCVRFQCRRPGSQDFQAYLLCQLLEGVLIEEIQVHR